ncbi:polysaccharide deacetylase family protein [Amycolatopsis decaplanina]|uniref:DUF2334 domain-containing protein n=1 Tax=Amycolatopsis decaplanina DSM 44594 TaxID=1284240 RepID=M2YUQ1_9PSEU|nr:polysaccharide deacetylase family protein [Amycolatopsis decaplanina]EME58607.1 hypothetical protein H074_18548 [Amycolatopsis decaplanina DSM 44594]
MSVLITAAHRRSRSWPAWFRLACAFALVGSVAVAVSVVGTDTPITPSETPSVPGKAGDPAPGAQPGWSTLVLYEPGAGESSGEVLGVQAANLVSHGGSFALRQADRYRPGDASKFSSIVYIGHRGATPVSDGLLADLAIAGKPVLWVGYGIERWFDRDPARAHELGWRPAGRDEQAIAGIDYKGVRLGRDDRAAPPTRVELMDAAKAQVLAEVVHDDGGRTPWAVRSGTLTYIAEIPFSYVGQADRYLAAADLLRPPVSPARVPRALVRLEDVGPVTDPGTLRAIADHLAEHRIPFTVAVYPRHRDPRGVTNNGVPLDIRLTDRPDLVDALRYLISRGGALVLHGYTHQYGDEPNPQNGVSAADYEFYRARLGAGNATELVGPVPDDSFGWARDRIGQALSEIARAGLPRPTMFEFPHYTASAVDYQAATTTFGTRYERGTYFRGWCEPACGRTGPVDPAGIYLQTFPYLVRDVYGAVVVPENLGYLPAWQDDSGRDRAIAAVVAEARALRVVDDGVASFFYHPALGVEALGKVIDGIQAAGYRFVPAAEIGRG